VVGQQAIVVVVVASVAIAPLAFAYINEASGAIELYHEEIIVEDIVLRRGDVRGGCHYSTARRSRCRTDECSRHQRCSGCVMLLELELMRNLCVTIESPRHA
jgi:hypothetical protein